MAERSRSVGVIASTLSKHVEHMFPAEVIQNYKREMQKRMGDSSGDVAPPVVPQAAPPSAAPPLAAPLEPAAAAGLPPVPPGAAPVRPRPFHVVAQSKAAAPKKVSKKEGAVKCPPMPPCGIMTDVDSLTAEYVTKACNFYRNALPDSFSEHPVFASGMKIDQTLHKFVGVRMRRREAFLKVLYPEAWVINDITHPVDAVPGEFSTRIDLAFRLATYNEVAIWKNTHEQDSQKQDDSQGEGEGADPVVPTAKKRRGEQSKFEKALRRIIAAVKRVGVDGLLKYDRDHLRAYDQSYRNVAGWMAFSVATLGRLLSALFIPGSPVIPTSAADRLDLHLVI